MDYELVPVYRKPVEIIRQPVRVYQEPAQEIQQPIQVYQQPVRVIARRWQSKSMATTLNLKNGIPGLSIRGVTGMSMTWTNFFEAALKFGSLTAQ